MVRRGNRPVLKQSVAARLATVRRAVGLTQDELSSRLGTALRNYQRMESGTQNLTLDTVERVCAALQVPVDRVVTISEDRPRGLPSLHLIATSHDGEPPRPTPVFHLDAAAGYARSGRSAAAVGWTLLATPPRRRQFVAQVTGRSMEPLIPDGSWCLFAPSVAVAVGGIGLFEVGTTAAPEDGGAYVVKRLVRRSQGQLVLDSINRTFASIEPNDVVEIKAVAEWIGVVAGPDL